MSLAEAGVLTKSVDTRSFPTGPQKNRSAIVNLPTLVFLGSSTWARTRDLRINSPALYQLSYRGTAYHSSSMNCCRAISDMALPYPLRDGRFGMTGSRENR